MEYGSLGEVLISIKDGSIRDGEILTNLETSERVIVHEGALHFVTFNDYVSNEVPLVKGMIEASWEREVTEYTEVGLEEAMRYLTEGKEIIVQEPTVFPEVAKGEEYFDIGRTNTVEEFLKLIIGSSDITNYMEDLSYLVKKADAEKPKGSRKTTETEAWAILMDRYLHDIPVKKIADKFGISLRNAYYIVDGTYYTDVFERFNQLLETGELY